MGITVFPITESFAAEIGDVDLSKRLTRKEADTIKEAFWQYAVLIFPGQRLTRQQHLDFARHFGPLETTIRIVGREGRLRLPKEFADVSNLDVRGRPWAEQSKHRMFQLGNRLWHTDSSFKYLPARASLLYARSIPPVGGHTEFADQRAAYDALPEAMQRRIEGLVAEHAIHHSRARIDFTEFEEADLAGLPAVPQVVVRTLPETGRKSLYVASHAGRILGMPRARGRALIDKLLAHATQRQFVYTHRWRKHDLVMWDDRCTLHRGTPFDDLRWKRDMQRATVLDVANTCEQAGIEGVA